MEDQVWLAIGLVGQGLFTSRFLVQWIASERLRRSVLPTAFWWLSLAGGVTLFAYALWRRDLVFSIGQATGIVIYLRNIVLVTRSRAAERRIDSARPRSAA